MKKINRKYLILFLTALIIRLIYTFVPAVDYYAKSFPVSFKASEQYSDAATYVEMANGLLEKGYPAMKGRLIMFSGYVYPFVLAMFIKMSQNLIPLFIFQAVLSSLVCLMVAKISSVIVKHEIPGLISGYLWAFYYPALITVSRSLTEAVFTFLFVGIVYYIVVRKSENKGAWFYITVGLLISAAALTRAILFYVFIVMLVFYLVYNYVETKKINYKILLTVFGFIVLQIPWSYLGYQHNNKIIIVSTGGGANLALGTYIPGNGEYEAEYFLNDPNHPLNIIDKLYLDNKWTDSQRDSAFIVFAKKQIEENIKYRPLETARLLLYQVSRFWFNMPYLHKPGIGNRINSVVTFFLLAFMVYGYFKARKKNKMVSDMLLVLIIMFCLLHTVTISIIRYSFPLIPIVYVFSGYGIYMLFQKFKTLKNKDREA